MSKISLKTSSTQPSLKKLPKKDLKPFGFCCSLDRFNSLSRYDQRLPPYESSLTAITSIHECPTVKMRMKFSTSRLLRDRKRSTKTKTSDVEDEQQRLENDVLNYFLTRRNNRFIKQYLEDEIALAKDIFWAEKQRRYNEASDKAIKIAKKKNQKKLALISKTYPRWFQDFSLDQMKNLMKLQNVMRIDYEETKTSGTQMILIAIGVISTFFKLAPNTIKELHKSSNLNSVDFLREIYKILTGNDFYQEGYKKVYSCNERIILSAIAFLTLPETVKELHKRLPPVIMPKLPPKPKPPICLPRQKDSCPYKEELFKRPDWAGYRNALQKWRKQRKLIAIPKVTLSLNNKYKIFINNGSEIKEREKDICAEYLKKTSTKELQEISLTTREQNSVIDEQRDFKDKDFSREKNVETERLAIFDIFQSEGKKSDYKSLEIYITEDITSKTLDPPKLLETKQKLWLDEKNIHDVTAGTFKDSQDCPVTEITNDIISNEKFFSVLKLDDQSRKVFPSGRENLSRNWQEWLQNVDEDYRQLEEETDELIRNVQAIMKLVFPVCDSCCLCRQTRKFYENLQQSEIDKIPISMQNGEKNMHIIDSKEVQSSEGNVTKSSINQVTLKDEAKTNIDNVKETEQSQYISDTQKDKIHVLSEIPESPQFIKNIPPCSCAIRQMTDKDISPSMSKDDFSWIKEEGLCPGKKYRPDELGAYSCKTYPDDKCCKYNPFLKEIMNISQIAPSAKILKTDYEAIPKTPTWFTTSSPLRMQEKSNNISSLKQFNKTDKLSKHKFTKKNETKNVVNKTEKIARKHKMTKLKNIFKSTTGNPHNIQSAVLSKELLTINDFAEENTEKKSCNWKIRSEQDLLAKKTLAYLCEPDYPLEMMAVRPGGQPCQCREKRRKKKILISNTNDLMHKERTRKTELEEEDEIIDDVSYFTPPISPRRSDEYIPEYDILKSPYDMCVSEAMDKTLKLIERYSGPKSLIEKIRKKPKSCNCTNIITKDNGLVNQNKNIEEERKKLMELKSSEERWKIALKDAALMDYFTRREDNTPCWTSCKKIARVARPRRLKIVKPVCECKYERKIVEHEERKQKACQQKLDDLKISTSFQIPMHSKEDIRQTVALHRHWSPINIPPGPLPTKDVILKKEMEARKKARDEAFKLIYGDKNEKNMSYLTTRETLDEQKLTKKIQKKIDTKESYTNVKNKTPKTRSKLQSLNKKTNKIGHQTDANKENVDKIIRKKKIYSDEVAEVNHQKNVLHKQAIEQKTEKKINNGSHRLKGGGDKKYINSKFDLVTIMKAELEKMAAEGYTFAKLPECYLMPQLQDWLMYRKGVAFSEIDKKNLMQATVGMWALINKKLKFDKKPSLHLTEHQLKRLTYYHAEKIKEKIRQTTAIFHSKIRKARVSYARIMWSTMQYGKFPSMSFKRTFFTYMPSKEADGHVYRPWLPSEVHERDFEFSCY
ncbi:uncharacterized protein LOC105424749 [Pogonomyrmex barbatus]|uniref:Uncharacterized protein LOC105424749 n=1 Tax=Pogonomyrmex barbatus TaxID=144034 RepID=A0A8N1S424_9HYME|nr:uncharacterized protein LOC105424749 [Pogonomyrmex barbatus]